MPQLRINSEKRRACDHHITSSNLHAGSSVVSVWRGMRISTRASFELCI